MLRVPSAGVEPARVWEGCSQGPGGVQALCVYRFPPRRRGIDARQRGSPCLVPPNLYRASLTLPPFPQRRPCHKRDLSHLTSSCHRGRVPSISLQGGFPMEWWPWLVGLAGFGLLLILGRRKPFDHDAFEEEQARQAEYRHRYVPPTKPPTTNSLLDADRRWRRLAHMGAPSPGARQPEWLRMARREAGEPIAVASPSKQADPIEQPKPAAPQQRRSPSKQYKKPVWALSIPGSNQKAASRKAARRKMPAVTTQRWPERWEIEEEIPLPLDDLAGNPYGDEEYYGDEYPHDTDWDDHDMDWGETK